MAAPSPFGGRMKTSTLLALICTVALSAEAATLTPGPCPAGPLFSLGTATSVVVAFRDTRPAATIFGTPTFAIAGNSITVERRNDGLGGGDACASDSVDLGSLAAGAYELTWNDQMPGGTRTTTYKFFVGLPVSFDDYLQPSVIAPVAPLITGTSVRLIVNWCTLGQAVIGAPVADVTDGTIHVTQGITADSGPLGACALHLIDFGNLPARRYDVAFSRRTVAPTNIFNESAAVAFIVQRPAPSSVCVGLPVAVTVMADGTARLHFEDVRGGYDPAFGPPSVVDIRAGVIKIEQLLADSGNYLLPGAAPTHDICHAEEFNLDVLPAGSYTIDWEYLATLAGNGVYRLESRNEFVWSGSEVLCSDSGKFATDPVVPVAGRPIVLSLTRMYAPGFIAPTTVSIKGNEITVSDYVDTEGPVGPPPSPRCQTTSATLASLPAGEYVVHWKVIDFGITTDVGTFTFAVVAPQGRRRAAR